MQELILSAKNNYEELKKYLLQHKVDNIFIVCFKFQQKPSIIKFLESLDIKLTFFSNYKPNPTYESVCEGITEFRKSGSKFIISIGGGSAMDVAKCIKLYSNLDDKELYFKQEVAANDIKLMAIPTTAGTGSEATKYAVIYYKGEKLSITHESIIPSIVLLDSSLLETLPLYQKKATVMDAFAHSIESYWSINSNEESKNYSKKALALILSNYESYLNGDISVYENMLIAANFAGKAINITQTTAGHAMCYKITSLYDIPHGHAAILVDSVLLPYMLENMHNCIDARGQDYLMNTFSELRSILACNDLANYLNDLLIKLDLYNVSMSVSDIDTLVNSVNETRLKNNPIRLDKADIKEIYLNLYKRVEKR